MDVAEEARARQVIFGVAEEAFGRRAAVAEGEVRAQQRDAAPAFLDERAKPLLAIFELDLRAFAFGNIAQECGERLIVAASDAIDGDFDGELLAVRAPADSLHSA